MTKRQRSNCRSMAVGQIRAGGVQALRGRALLRKLAKEELRSLQRRAQRYNQQCFLFGPKEDIDVNGKRKR